MTSVHRVYTLRCIMPPLQGYTVPRCRPYRATPCQDAAHAGAMTCQDAAHAGAMPCQDAAHTGAMPCQDAAHAGATPCQDAAHEGEGGKDVSYLHLFIGLVS